MVPDDSLTIRERAIAAWPPAWHGQNLRDILITLGYDVDRPWRDLPQEGPRLDPLHRRAADRAGLRRATRRRRCGARSSARRSRAIRGRSPSARRHVLHTFANTAEPADEEAGARSTW